MAALVGVDFRRRNWHRELAHVHAEPRLPEEDRPGLSC
jgi:hypothetical protein